MEAGRPWLNRYLAQLDFDARGQLGRIDVPILVLGGIDDSLVPQRDIEQLAAGIPTARLNLFPDAGHLLDVEAPTRFLAKVTGFLTGR